MAIAVDEMANSPWCESSGGRLTWHRVVKIAWDDLLDYIYELLPPSVTVGSSVLTYAGQPFPHPSLSQYRVSGYKMVPLHENEVGNFGLDPGGMPRHEFAVVDISYNLLPGLNLPFASYDPVPLLTHTMNGGGKVFSIPNAGMKYRVTTGTSSEDYRDTPAEMSLSVFVPTTQHETHWPMVPNPNWLVLESLKGAVNNAPFTLRGFPYAAENVLYLGYTARQSVMSIQVDEPLWDVTLRFEIYTVPAADYLSFGSVYGGHNHKFINDLSSGFFGFYRVSTGPSDTPPNTPIYRLADFSPLYTSVISATL